MRQNFPDLLIFRRLSKFNTEAQVCKWRPPKTALSKLSKRLPAHFRRTSRESVCLNVDFVFPVLGFGLAFRVIAFESTYLVIYNRVFLSHFRHYDNRNL